MIDSNSNWGMKSLKILTSRARPRFLRIRCSNDGQWLENWDCIVLCALVSENVKSVHWLVKSMSCVSTGLIVTFRSLTNWLIDVWESELVVMGSISTNLTQDKNALHGQASCTLVWELTSCLGRYDSMDWLSCGSKTWYWLGMNEY